MYKITNLLIEYKPELGQAGENEKELKKLLGGNYCKNFGCWNKVNFTYPSPYGDSSRECITCFIGK